jgi:rod shape-determining protein MreD
MPWGLYTVALLLVYLAQSAVLPHFAPQWLDLFLAFALVCGLTAPVADARLAAWIAGLAQDIGGDGPLGIHALALGLAAWLLTCVRELANRELWWVRWLAGFITAAPAQLVLQVHARYYQGAAISWPGMIGYSLLSALAASLLAAAVVRLPTLLRRRRAYSAGRW